MTAVGVFVSPHGMGHAARAAAVMDDLAERLPGGVTFELFTQVPERIFTASCRAPIRYHRMETDVGLVQTTPFDEDLPATVAKLAAFLPFDAAAISRLAATLHGADCRFVLCDIAPMGILAAREAGLPFGCITRARSPESPPLEAFIRREMQGLPIGAAALAGGAWIDRLPELFALPRMRRETENGAAAAGRFIVERQRD